MATGAVNTSQRIGDLLREFAPQVLGTLVRRHGQFDAARTPCRRHCSRRPSSGRPRGYRTGRGPGCAGHQPTDDTLVLLFLCCHPALSAPSQLALTLRAVGGLTTAEIAAAFLVPEAAIAKCISRAKQHIRGAGTRFELPPPAERADRLGVVLQVLYLVFNEGYTSSSGPALHRADLTAEAIRLTRVLHRLLPGEGEIAGLLALMLLTDARRAARTDPDGSIVPLAEQRRELWSAAAIAEGQALLTATLGRVPVGSYQIQAAIAADHDGAATAEATDWPQILALYDVLAQVAPGPVVTLSRAVALAMVHGPKGRARAARHSRHRRADGQHPPPRSGPGAPARTGGRPARGARVLPARGDDDRQRARASLSDAARRPAAPAPTARLTRPADPAGELRHRRRRPCARTSQRPIGDQVHVLGGWCDSARPGAAAAGGGAGGGAPRRPQ